MAQTDAKAGFRLPWSSDRQSSDTFDGDSQAAAQSGWPTEDGSPSNGTATLGADATAPVDPWASPAPSPEPAPAPSAPTPPPAGRKPTKFMADLTKAMQAAAEDARSRAIRSRTAAFTSTWKHLYCLRR